MLHVRRELAVSERRACRVVGQPRSTQRHPSKRPSADRALVARLLQIARDYPRYGYRRAWAVLRGEGWAVNRKRIHRLWREAGLQVPQKARKRRRVTGGTTGENSTVRLAPQHPNHVWSYDFVFDATEDGRALKLLTVLDEYTRECLALVVGRSLTSRHVVATLAQLIGERGAPGVVRSNPTHRRWVGGGEFIAHRVAAYLHASTSDAKHIDPGAPWQNGCAESFNPPASAGREAPRRTAGPGALRLARRGGRAHRAVAPSLQRIAAAQRARLPFTGRVCGHSHPPTGAGTVIDAGTKNGGRSRPSRISWRLPQRTSRTEPGTCWPFGAPSGIRWRRVVPTPPGLGSCAHPGACGPDRGVPSRQRRRDPP